MEDVKVSTRGDYASRARSSSSSLRVELMALRAIST